MVQNDPKASNHPPEQLSLDFEAAPKLKEEGISAFEARQERRRQRLLDCALGFAIGLNTDKTKLPTPSNPAEALGHDLARAVMYLLATALFATALVLLWKSRAKK